MEIHGASDLNVNIGGGYVNSYPYPSTLYLVNYWATHNHCMPTPIVTDLPNLDPNDGSTVRHYLYTGGDGGSTIEYYRIFSGGHTWPGWKWTLLNLGNICMDFSATQEIWRFFSAYKLNELTEIAEINQNVPCSLFPNPSKDIVTININGSIGLRQIVLLNSLGQSLNSIPVSEMNYTYSLDISGLPNGSYFIGLETEKSRYYSMFLKQQ